MSRIAVGFFSVPEPHIEGLATLHGRWIEALYELRDDKQIHRNMLFLQAADVALKTAELAGDDMYAALPSVVALLRRKIWPVKDQDVFSPEECRTWSRKLEQLKRRMGGEAKLLRAMERRDPDVPAAAVHEVYRAFTDILEAAVESGAGMLWAVLDREAEARLAARRAEKERALSAAGDPERPPRQTRDEVRADMRRLMEWSDRIQTTHELEETEDLTVVWLCVVPEGEVGAVRPILARALERQRAGQRVDAHDLGEEARARIAEVGSVTRLRKHGESLILDHLGSRLAAEAGDAHRELGLYSAAEADAFLSALRAWESRQGGEAEVIAALCSVTHVSEHLAGRAYRALGATLTAAVEHGAAFAWLVDRLGAYMESLERQRQ